MNEPMQERCNIESIVKIAIYLEGIKQGKGGNIQPLGNIDLENLWKAVGELRDYQSGYIKTNQLTEKE